MSGKTSSFSDRLIEALEITGMKQADLCNATGIPKSAISQYCSGAFTPKQKRTETIAHALNVDEAWLMGYDVPMRRKKDSSNLPSDAILYNPQRNTLADERLARITANYHQLNDEGQDKLADYSDDLVSTCRYSLKNSEHQALEEQA